MPTNIINITNTLTNIINMPAEVTNSVLRVAEMPPKAGWEIALMVLTALGAFATMASAIIMWRSVEEMRRQRELQQRLWEEGQFEQDKKFDINLWQGHIEPEYQKLEHAFKNHLGNRRGVTNIHGIQIPLDIQFENFIAEIAHRCILLQYSIKSLNCYGKSNTIKKICELLDECSTLCLMINVQYHGEMRNHPQLFFPLLKDFLYSFNFKVFPLLFHFLTYITAAYNNEEMPTESMDEIIENLKEYEKRVGHIRL